MDLALKRAIRSSFDKAADGYEAAAFLQQEVARRLYERLELMKIVPGTILDAGCGTGFALPMLRKRYPHARLIGLDLAHNMLRRAQEVLPEPWLQRLASRLTAQAPRQGFVCADMERLPLATNSIDFLWSSLAMQWVDDLERCFQQMHRVIRPGGLLLFTTFGPDTLRELRGAFVGLDGYGHVNRFLDMHDIGDMLVHAGFQHPVMEMERITLTYADLKSLLGELKGMGAHTVLEGRRRGLMGRKEWQRLQSAYEAYRQEDGRLPATWEVVYGHAWAGAKDRLEGGRQIIQMKIAGKRGLG